MLRFLYLAVIRLHPSDFRNRFGDEMLSILDNTKSTRAALALLVDGTVSLARQWLTRPASLNEPALMAATTTPATDDVPSFATFESFHPQTSALLDGLVLSIALFCFTCFAIRYSWIRVLHIRIPEVQAQTQPFMRFSAIAPAQAARSGEATNKQTGANPSELEKDDISPHLQVQPMPVERGSSPSAFELTTRSSKAALGLRVQPLQRSGMVPLNLRSYVGIYVCSSPKFTISVTAEDDGSLAARIDDQPKLTMSQVSATTFVINGTGDRIEFDQASEGVIHQLRFIQGSQQYTAERQ